MLSGSIPRMDLKQPDEYWIPLDNIQKLSDKLSKLNDTAIRLGATPIKFTLTEEIKEEKVGPSEVIVYQKVVVEGERPRFDGWEFVARVEHTPKGNVVYVAPGRKVAERYLKSDSVCEHCYAKRKRTNTYLVEKSNGEQMQVGSSCLADFLGHKSPKDIAWLASFLTELGDTIQGFQGGGSRQIVIDDVLAMSAAVIRLHGWMSSTMAQKIFEEQGKHVTPTSTIVSSNLFPTPEFLKYETPIVPGDADRELARKAREWAASQAGLDNYLHNIRVIAKNDYLPKRSFGIAVSIIPAYKRAIEPKEQKEHQEPEWLTRKKNSQYVGKVGERMDFRLTVDKVIPVAGQFGASYITILHDDSGNVFKWSASSQLDEGETYSIKATIKEHAEYDGGKQTVITRGKISENVRESDGNSE